MRIARVPRTPLALITAAVLLGGCTGDTRPGPAPEDFAAGVCRQAAPDVLELADLVRDLGEGPKVAEDTKAALRTAQRRLAETTRSSSGPERTDLDGLVETVGLLRLRADGNTFEPFLARDAQVASDRVVARCTEE